MDEEREPRTAAELARRTAIGQVVSTLTYVGVMVGISWAVANRDVLWRTAQRGRNWWQARHSDPYAAEVAAFRREIADINRGSDGPHLPAEAGLYGPAADRRAV